jgi:diguanylate cyclase (GGDEF)-like protein
MINVTSDGLETVLATIEDALAMHQIWCDNLHRTLACRLAPAKSYIADGAHRQCEFGHWYYSESNAHFRDMPAFRNIGEAHENLHQSAREICIKAKSLGMLLVEDYDQFLGSMSSFRKELHDLRLRVSFTLQNIDALTGTFNQSKLIPDLRAVQKKQKQSGKPYSLLLLDIDLKKINSIHGRDFGDNILSTAIQSVKEVLGSSDSMYRYAGAEFIICLPDRNAGDAELIKEKLLKKIGAGLAEAAGASIMDLNIQSGILGLDPNANLEELLNKMERSAHTVKP